MSSSYNSNQMSSINSTMNKSYDSVSSLGLNDEVLTKVGLTQDDVYGLEFN